MGAIRQMQIRELTEDDASAFWSLRLRGLRDEPAAFGSSFEESRELPLDYARAILRREGRSATDFVLGAFEAHRLAGIVGFEREQRKKRAHRAKVWGMYVAADARGCGVGRRLLGELLERARALEGLEVVNLTVIAGNLAAERLYRSLGFEEWGLERRALRLEGSYHDERCMALRL